ncbi:MAG: glycoside hydrolase family 36 protein [bacterium]
MVKEINIDEIRIREEFDALTVRNRLVQMGYDFGRGLFSIRSCIAGSVMLFNIAAEVVGEVDGESIVWSTADFPYYEWSYEAIARGYSRGCRIKVDHSRGGRAFFHVYFEIFNDDPFIVIWATVENLFGEPLRVQRISPVAVLSKNQGSVNLGHITTWRWLQNGWRLWDPVMVGGVLGRPNVGAGLKPARTAHRGTAPDRLGGGSFISDSVGLLYDFRSYVSALLGFITGESYNSYVHFEVAGEDLNWLRATSDLSDLPLEQGASASSEKLLVDLGNGYRIALDNYIQAIRRENDISLWKFNPVIWSTWHTCHFNVDEEKILRHVDFLSRNRDRYPVDYILIGDGYQKDMGDWVADPRRFPRGLGVVIDEIRRRGFRVGLTISPFAVSSSSELFSEHRDWIIKNEGRRPIPAGRWMGRTIYGLDATIPEVVGWIDSLFSEMARRWKIDLFKLDYLYCGALPRGVYGDPRRCGFRALREGVRAIRRAVGEHTLLSASGAPLGAVMGVVDAFHLSGDIANRERRGVRRKIFWGGSLLEALQNSVRRFYLHNGIGLGVIDCLLLGGGKARLTDRQIRTLTSLVGLLSGTLVLNDDLEALPPQIAEYLDKILPPRRFAATPLDLFSEPLPNIFVLEANDSSQISAVIGIFNWHKSPIELGVNLRQAGLPVSDNRSYHVFEFWSESYYGAFREEIPSMRVEPYDCLILAVKAVKAGKPQVISTSCHIGQGIVEVSSEIYIETKRRMHLSLIGKRGTSRKVFLYVPRHLEIETVIASDRECRAARHDRDVVAVSLRFQNEREELTIVFRDVREEGKFGWEEPQTN